MKKHSSIIIRFLLLSFAAAGVNCCFPTVCFGPDDGGIKVAVLPFANFSDTPGVEKDLTGIFASELVRQTDMIVSHPKIVEKCLEDGDFPPGGGVSEAQARQLAGLLGVDAVISGAVIEYDGFYPPTLGMSLKIFMPGTGKTVFSGSRVYDSRMPKIKRKALRYARRCIGKDDQYGWEIVFIKKSHYMRFFCYELVRERFRRVRRT